MALSKINTNQIVDGAVATADIADGLITTAKLADGAVTTAKITDDAVTTAKVNPTQTDITSVGTLTSATVSGDLTVDTSTLKVDSSNNRVGIGETSPSAPLHMETGTTTDIMRFGANGRWGFQRANSDSRYLSLSRAMNGTASSVLAVDGDNGRVGIGTTTPSDKLHIKGGFLQLESNAGDASYVRIDNDANSGGKIWRVGDGVSAHGTFSIYNQTDNAFPFNISLDGVTGGSANAGVARYRNHSSLTLGYGSTVQFTVGQGLINVSNRSYGFGALFMVSYASQVAEVSDPSGAFDIGTGGTILGAGVYKSNNNYTAFVINKDPNLGTRGFSIQVISNDF